MEKKGFTLVEVMGVIIILSILAVLVSQVIINRVKEIDKDMERSAVSIIISSARDYVEDNPYYYKKESNVVYCLDYEELIDSTVLNDEMIPNLDSVSYLKDWTVEARYNGNLFEYKMLENCTPSAEGTGTKYILTINLNGGNSSQGTIHELKKAETLEIINPTRNQYVFDGWTVSGTGSSMKDTTFKMGITDATITAKWKQFYTLTINLNGGSSSQETTHSVLSEETLEITNPTRNGYVFDGWTVTGTGSSINGTTFKMGTANAAITAKWKQKYILTINLNGGSSSQVTTHSMLTDETVKITNPTRNEYVFGGWTVSGTGSSINGTTFKMGTANTTITAVWNSCLSPGTYTYTGNSQNINDGNGNYRIRFLTSGTFTSQCSKVIDMFLVGGGGGSTPSTGDSGGGSGGGYTTTFKNKEISANTQYSVVIGAGGSVTSSGQRGGTTTFLGFYAEGGYPNSGNSGGKGGSGGGCGGPYHAPGGYYCCAGAGGSNGGSGGSNCAGGGAGQNLTTREFEEGTGNLYAGGGGGFGGYYAPCGGNWQAGGSGGGGSAGNPGAANTGGGGGARAAGGSGIVIIRNSR